MRERWIDVLEWYYSERCRRHLRFKHDQLNRPGKERYDGYSEDELLELADFGIFIDLSAMPQVRLASERL